jgi:hypothetical protein
MTRRRDADALLLLEQARSGTPIPSRRRLPDLAKLALAIERDLHHRSIQEVLLTPA